MNEFEIRRALAGAAAPAATADPERLRAALVHADRMKTVRMAMAVGAVTLVASLGMFLARTGETTAPTNVVDQPDQPAPDPSTPFIDDASAETTTTTVAATTTAPAPANDPSHLATPTTTEPPALVTATTTLPPVTTTTAPPPTTTAAPTTTSPTTTTAPTTTTTEAAVAFTAQARYGSCEEDPPYDEYSGTAAPGATITVTSAYNATTQTTADGNGDWFVRVEFPTAPVDEHFDVTVGDGTDSQVFDFVRTA
ncbi:MAG: hypothetical protein R8F63_08935 [Acidimicrobiales bacterium]|nr:hypothetical protein [Acidimicrobiales bacterium]